MDNLAVTDPDLALIRKNFIEQEVLPHGKLPAKPVIWFCWRHMLPHSRRKNLN